MDKESQKLFDEIVAKDPQTLSEYEAGFLWARQSYLTAAQREKFQMVLVSPSVRSVVDTGIEQVKTEAKLDRNKLYKQAREMGLPVNKALTALQLQALIDDAKAVEEFQLEDAELAREAAEKKAAEEAAVVEEAEVVGHAGNFTNKPIQEN